MLLVAGSENSLEDVDQGLGLDVVENPVDLLTIVEVIVVGIFCYGLEVGGKDDVYVLLKVEGWELWIFRAEFSVKLFEKPFQRSSAYE